MSRSYRKPVYKDGGHWKKQLHARAYRRMVKQVCKVFLLHLETGKEPVFKHPYQITNPYDICDWWYWSEDPKARRK